MGDIQVRKNPRGKISQPAVSFSPRTQRRYRFHWVCYYRAVRCEWQNHSFVTNKYVCQALFQSLHTKNELWKLLGNHNCCCNQFPCSSSLFIHFKRFFEFSLLLFFFLILVAKFQLFEVWYQDTSSFKQRNNIAVTPNHFPKASLGEIILR